VVHHPAGAETGRIGDEHDAALDVFEDFLLGHDPRSSLAGAENEGAGFGIEDAAAKTCAGLRLSGKLAEEDAIADGRGWNVDDGGSDVDEDGGGSLFDERPHDFSPTLQAPEGGL